MAVTIKEIATKSRDAPTCWVICQKASPPFCAFQESTVFYVFKLRQASLQTSRQGLVTFSNNFVIFSATFKAKIRRYNLRKQL